MELKQLRSYAAVVRYGSFTKAAEMLFISQPTISAHVRQLETELGVSLILRDTRKLTVTERGWELYECAQHMIDLEENLLQSWAKDDRQILHLGASTIPSAYILPEVLPEYGRKNPGTYFVVQQGDSDEVTQGLVDGLYDLALIGAPMHQEGFVCEPFYTDRMVLITPVSEKYLTWQKKKLAVTAELLSQEDVILREQGSGSLKSAGKFLKAIGVEEEDLHVVARLNDQESIKNLVAGGMGISFISEKAAENLVGERRLLAFPLGSESARRSLYAAWPKGKSKSGSVRKLAEFIRAFYAKGTKK